MMPIVKRLSAFILMSGLLLGGCQTPPPPPTPAGLTAAQVDALKSQGFVQTDDGWMFGLADKLLFPTDESRLAGEQKQVIERITRALLAVNITGVRIEGHADNSGTEPHNETLSLARARMVGDVMVGAGMPAQGVHAEGMGTRDPVASNATPEGRRENRRVAIIVSN